MGEAKPGGGRCPRVKWRTGWVGILLPIVTMVAVPMALAQAGPQPVPQPVSVTGHAIVPVGPYTAFVSEAADRFGLSQDWIWAVMHTESGGNPRAVSPVGAMGLMQIMPATWTALTTQHRLGGDPFDIRANILAGAAYLRAMRDRYGDISSTLAAYNAGPKRVDDWRAGLRALPAETVAYVTRIAPALQGGGSQPRLGPQLRRLDWRAGSLFAGHGFAGHGNAAPEEEAVSKAPGRQAPDDPTSTFRAPVGPSTVGLFAPPSGRPGS